jgi:riboflavin biosynthesis pyrimidine reductase
MVSSVDGAAWRDGTTSGLGSPADQRLLALLRGLSDVIIVGANTVRVEGYKAVRPRPEWAELRTGRTAAPRLAVVSGALEFDFTRPPFTGDGVRAIVITSASAPAARLDVTREHADVVQAGETSVDLDAALTELAQRGLRRQLTEGGPHLLGQLLGRLDELCLTVSPVLLGGDASRITNGPPLPAGRDMRLRHILVDANELFLRYVAESP